MTAAGFPPWTLTVEPRGWQTAALGHWEEAGQRGIVAVVTGAGKTVFAEACLLAFRARHPDGRAVIVVPTLALLDQWYVSLREDAGVPAEAIATYSGEGRPAKPGLVNLAVLNTARQVAPPLADLGPTLLVIDEVHRAASPVNALALAGTWQATLGMSATPEREYDGGLDDVLVPALGPVIFRYDYRQAVADGVITRFELINVELELQPDERARYDGLSRKVAPLLRRLKQGEPVEGPLKRLLQQRAAVSAAARLRIPVAVRLVLQHRGARTLVFHERIDAAEALVVAFKAQGLNATIYHSRIGPELRRDNLRLFRRGVFDELVTCRALDEGVNVPETTVAVIASSTASTRQRIQRLGRVLRPAPGKALATVYTLFATEVERRRLAREAEAGTGAERVSWLRGAVSARG